MPLAIAWQDHLVVAVYLVGMVWVGAYFSRRQKSDEEYFLAGRRMPWFAVGMSIIATLLSSLTYLSEPGEVFRSGVTHLTGKMLAIPLEMLLVWIFLIPFMMRFRFTSAYEYLQHRYGGAARRVGVVLFLCLVVAWMGFVVLASSRALATVADLQLWQVIATVGLIATVYTVMGGLRAVIWTDVLQVILLVGGALLTLVFVAAESHSTPIDWYRLVVAETAGQAQGKMLLWSFDPTVRATVVTVALSMGVWHVCTHICNQMTVQRYFSTSDVTAARRSFVTGSLAGVLINLLLTTVGMALYYFYYQQGGRGTLPLAGATAEVDMIFPRFAVDQLPPGLAGGMLSAMLAAAMSSIDSGINSIATVLSVEWRKWRTLAMPAHTSVSRPGAPEARDHVRAAQVLTLLVGLLITAAAYGLDHLTADRNIVEMMPRSFNCFLAPLGAMFLIGIFIPWVGQRSVIAAALCGFVASICLAYGQEIFGLEKPVSFTWVMPGSLLTSVVFAMFFGLLDWLLGKSPARSGQVIAGLTWYTRHEALPAGVPAAEDDAPVQLTR